MLSEHDQPVCVARAQVQRLEHENALLRGAYRYKARELRGGGGPGAPGGTVDICPSGAI